MYKHYLITRFNIKINGHGPERLSPFVMNEQWLMDRLPFFMKYCAPSVLAQVRRNFTWVIYFDEDTPQFVFDQISFLKELDIPVEFFFVADFDHMLSDIRQLFKRTEEPYIISSRLDNDDILSDQYIRLVQDAFTPRSNTVINLNAGFVYYMDRKILTRWRNKFTNQFSSIIESNTADPSITIYGFPHWKPPQSSMTIAIPREAGWMEMVHSGNNRIRSVLGIPVFSRQSLSAFPEIIRTIDVSTLNTLSYTIRWFPSIIWRRIKSVFRWAG